MVVSPIQDVEYTAGLGKQDLTGIGSPVPLPPGVIALARRGSGGVICGRNESLLLPFPSLRSNAVMPAKTTCTISQKRGEHGAQSRMAGSLCFTARCSARFQNNWDRLGSYRRGEVH